MPADAQFRPDLVFPRVISILESLGLRYAVGGSVASSIRGVERSTQDLDVLVELPESKARPLVDAFAAEFYVSEAAVREAISRHRSFNVIHLKQGIKADLFVAGGNVLDEGQLGRATREEIVPESGATAFVTSAEDIVLRKLDWFRRGREVSDRQMEDVKNVLKATESPDVDYMRTMAEKAGVADLLDRALRESGLTA